MKKFLIAFLLSVAFLTNTACFAESTIVCSAKCECRNVIKQTVYRTETGRRYHKNSCHHLKYSKFPIEKAVARQAGLTPCQSCKP